MALLLIGLPDEIQKRIESAAGAAACISVDTVAAAGPHLAKAVLAVITADRWAEWVRIERKERPRAYVVVVGGTLDVKAQEEALVEKALRWAPLAQPEALVADIIACWQGLLRPRNEDSDAVKADDLAPKGAGNDTLVGWAMGRGGEARAVLETMAAEVELPGLGAGKTRGKSKRPAVDEAFLKLPARLCLELYSYYRFEALFKDKDDLKPHEEAAARTTGKQGSKLQTFILENFERHYFRDVGAMGSHAVLVLGETGTGKTLVARRLHQALEDRAVGVKLPFHHINCSTLREMGEVELFGAMRGAYTSLDVTNPGKIISSYGGTLFLDEFGSLTPSAQAKLLLFLEDGTVTPMAWLGDPIRVPVQIIAATNENLVDRVSHGNFRADLYYRFRGQRITLPPLRDLRHDIDPLVGHFLQDESVNRGSWVRKVSRAALDRLRQHDYPGNVRELQAVVERAVDRSRHVGSQTITSADIEFEASTLPGQHSILAFIVREGTEGPEVLLRWNTHWGRYFVPSTRVENESYEACVKRELKDKLGLDEGKHYVVEPLADAPELKFIQFSVSDHRLKHYEFRPFRVTPTKEGFEVLKKRPRLRWLSVDPKKWPKDPSLLDMLQGMRGVFERLRP